MAFILPYILLVLFTNFKIQLAEDRSPSPEVEEMMLDSIAVEPFPNSEPWETDPEDRIYPS